jgi:hypothetical protein
MVATWRLALLPLLLAAAPLRAQSEGELKRYFEGKRVTLKIAMPGTEEGVDIYLPVPAGRWTIRATPTGSRITARRFGQVTTR